MVGIEQDECLLMMVKTHGREWKFIASRFPKSRAPLALKNRYSLLMRRLSRHSAGPPQAAINTGAVVRPWDAGAFGVSNGTTSSSSGSAVDLASLFGSSGDGHGNPADYPTISAGSSNSSLSNRPFRASMTPSSNPSITDMPRERRAGRGGFGQDTMAWTPTSAAAAAPWEDPEFWDRQAFLESGTDCNRRSSGPGPNREENEMTNMVSVPEHTAERRRMFPQDVVGTHVAGGSDAGNAPTPAAEVEYSVTCQRGRVKTLVNHLVDAALTEHAEGAGKEDPVTLTLRLEG